MNRRGARPMSGHDPGRLSACVCNTLRMVSRAVTQLYDDVLRPSGLRITQFTILATIARMGASNLRQLEDTLAIDQTTLTRSLNLLERGGVIERVPRPDGRIKAMRLLWLLAVSLPDPAGAELRGGGPVADAAEARRPGEGGSSRRGRRRRAAAEPTWRLDPVVAAVQALRGLNLTGAVTLIAEVGDLTRFDTPRKLMSYLGLTPSEYSSGEHRHQGGITKAGNGHARRALVEGAWAYRYPAKVSRHLQLRLENVPAEVRAIAWKAQLRLCKRYRLLSARGKHVNQVVVAIAREMAAFAWAIARTIPMAS